MWRDMTLVFLLHFEHAKPLCISREIRLSLKLSTTRHRNYVVRKGKTELRVSRLLLLGIFYQMLDA